ncbi:MAG: NUDIX hydrolase [Firmicutes bacterium]|nr:NUDIX hydrolase [Alicyclobacillaceae bacterium]MCL6496693.1 NUDIX hydrolase [Bacillota bacterium]
MGEPEREEAAGPGTVVFAGRTLAVRVDPVQIGGRATTREVVVRVPAVAVVAENANGAVLVIRQFRWAVGQWLWELPAGKVEAGESPEATARRELEEETGWRARIWEAVGRFFPSPGYTQEQVHLFYATDLHPGQAGGDADERVTVAFWDAQAVDAALAAGAVENGIAWLGLLWWRCRRTARRPCW